jgi:tRNA dimethylallyltransferase
MISDNRAEYIRNRIFEAGYGAVAVVGPTASGKTALSVELARRLGGEIISCDSMQIYRGMDIATAKATSEEQSQAPHHMLDLITPDVPYSAADYASDAERVASEIINRGHMPLFCGGTGLYLEAARTGRHGEAPQSDPEYRASLALIAQDEDGRTALHNMLKECDPDSAEAIHKNNVKRVMRAIEICLVTGEKKSDIDKKNAEITDRYDHKVITLAFESRELLYSRIDTRVDLMMEQGLLDETERLMAEGVFERSQTAAQAIGYKELLPYLRSEASLECCVDELKRATRRYAKRQITWFSGKNYAHKIYVDEGGRLKTFEDIVNISKKLF